MRRLKIFQDFLINFFIDEIIRNHRIQKSGRTSIGENKRVNIVK